MAEFRYPNPITSYRLNETLSDVAFALGYGNSDYNKACMHNPEEVKRRIDALPDGGIA